MCLKVALSTRPIEIHKSFSFNIQMTCIVAGLHLTSGYDLAGHRYWCCYTKGL